MHTKTEENDGLAEDRLGLAIRKPEATAGANSVNIQFETGPSARIFDYSVFCVEVGAGCKAEPVSTVATGSLTRTISTIDATVTGLFYNTTYDCYVTASSDFADKCQLVPVTTTVPLDVNLIGRNGLATLGSYFKSDVTSTDVATWSDSITQDATWTSLSGQRAAINWLDLPAPTPDTNGLYYVDNITEWVANYQSRIPAGFPEGWTKVTSEIGTTVNQADMKMDIYGDGLVAWVGVAPYGFWAVKDFTASGATWDVNVPFVPVVSASMDRNHVALGIEGDTEWIVGYTPDIFASSDSADFTTIVSYPIADSIIVENVALSGRFLAWVADALSGPTDVHSIYYVDLLSADPSDPTAEYVPIEIPLPETFAVDKDVQISIAGTTMVAVSEGNENGGVASTADFRTVTAGSWVIQNDGIDLDQVDASFNVVY